ncbi:MAG TPA: TonB family protein [Bryobacteraceae bacterium]|nr:TonB family protein [Bryobacteraceae bacterium]
MAHSVDLLDEREPIAGSVVFSIFLHVGVIVFVVGYGLYAKRMQAPFGEPNASAGIAVAVTPVSTIPIPKRQGPENPVANDSESVVPTPPEKQQTVEKQPEKAEVVLPDKVKPAKRQREEHRQQQRQQETKQNQIATRVPQAAVSPMYNMNTGSNGVGIGPNSPLGQRFGWYAEMVRKIIARNWATNGLAGTQSAPAIIGFTITRNGTITGVRIEQSSGNPAVDNSAWRAVLNSNPLPALPPQYTDSTAPAEFTFDLR